VYLLIKANNIFFDIMVICNSFAVSEGKYIRQLYICQYLFTVSAVPHPCTNDCIITKSIGHGFP
jgi:hypothetical protein